ncbi:MAG TPA: argininosuccinate lyase [Thermoanaerobaculia bacterium]|jgi:argininosuccinate lyase/amino-acid N-acetyltransferase|nr:argininosuccinate lyase [Thermoanaerobaculia bacterium]
MWGGRFSEGPSALLRALNDSFAFDRELFAEDVEGSIAWAHCIGEAGVLTSEEVRMLVDALRSFTLADSDAEDVHSYVESELRKRVGPLAGKLHTGRSRNDQVATDLKLWLKKACNDFESLATSLARALVQRAVDEAATPMPGYTHLKQAEPVTFGHWCLAYVAMLQRDIARINDARDRGDECPLGSGALAGTPLKIDREALAHSLGFARATANSLDAVSDRDFAAEYLFCASTLLLHLSRMAEDLIFITSDEAAYAELPDALATGSSRMPHKKNPDVLELTRGHSARAIGELTGFLALLKGLPLAYNKDLQLDKEPLFRTRTTLALLLPTLTALVSGLKILPRMSEAASSPLLLATDAADTLAATGIPFREAHEIVGRQGSVSTSSVQDVLAKKNVIGGTAPDRVLAAAKAALESLE